MSRRKYLPGRGLDEATVARAAQLLAQGRTIPEVMAALSIGEGSALRIRRGKHPALLRMTRKRRCPGCGGKLKRPEEPCRVCRDRRAITKGAA